jgi:predicted MFS family arabinose efflux permease
MPEFTEDKLTETLPPEKLDPRINVLAVAWCLDHFAISITYPFLPIYLNKERGFPMEQVGVVFLLMGLGRILGPSVAGPLVDTFGRRAVLVAGPAAHGAIVWALAVLVAFGAGFWTLAGMLFFTTFFGTFFSSASDAYTTDLTTPAQRPQAFSRIRVGLNTGWMLGPAIGAFMTRTPFAQLFAAAGAMCFATAVITWLRCTEKSDAATTMARSSTGARSFRRHFLRDRQFHVYLVLCFLVFLTCSQLSTTLAIYASKTVGIEQNLLGFLYTLNGLLVILLQIPLDQRLAGSSIGPRLAAGALCFALGYGALGWCTNYTHLLLAVSVFTAGEIVALPALNSLGTQLAPADMVGRYMGMYQLIFGVGYSIGPYIGSVLYARWADQPRLMWSVLASAAMLAAIGFLCLYCRKEPERVASAVSPPG